MIGYVTYGTNDLPRACAFYDALLEEFGAKRVMDDGRIVLYGVPDQPMFAICTPSDEQPATVGNGAMVALTADSKEQVQRLYDKALELGGTGDGEPGPRSGGPFYGGYFRDLDGNKFVAFYMDI